MGMAMFDDQRLIGFDFGLRRIGVATGQTITKTAHPLTTVLANNGIPPWQEMDKIIQEWQPAAIIVGLPLKHNDARFSITDAVDAFAKSLKARYDCPVYLHDERLTTKEARSRVFEEGGFRALQKEQIDAVAAQIILEGWMNNANAE
jgi:putative holliday junction resolvase